MSNPNDVVDKLWKQSVENVRLIESCQLHRFDFIHYTGPFSVRDVRCVNCKGRMPLPSVIAYIKGYIAAGKPESDVVANHSEPLITIRQKGSSQDER